MRSFNKVMLLGNLTADPVSKETKTGGRSASFSVATNRDWKNKEGEEVKETHFHRVIAFGRLAETITQFFKKGTSILVSGRLSTRSYTGKEGKPRYITEVVAEDFNFLPRNRSKIATTSVNADTGEISEVALQEIAQRFDLKGLAVSEVVDY